MVERRHGRPEAELRGRRETLEREWRLRQRAAPLHVLLVDCHPDEQDLYAFALAAAGYLPFQTCRLVEALQIAVMTQPHVVVVDASLPDDALTLVRHLREDERTRHALIVLISAYVEGQHTDAAMLAGCEIVLTKPCLPDTLLDALQQALRR